MARSEQQAGRELTREKNKSLIKRHHEVNLKMENLNVGSMASMLQQINNSNPSATIRMQTNLIKLKTLAARLKQEILLPYKEFLGYSDVIQQRPLINYLSPTLARLELK